MSNVDLEHAPSPRFSEQEVKEFARQLYGLDAQTIRELESYIDQNFYLEDEAGRRFVFKIANPAENIEVLDFQNKALVYLAEHSDNSRFPHVCTTLAGEQTAAVQGSRGENHFVRMLTFLPGECYANVQPQPEGLLHDLGYFMGTMDKALAGFCHPAAHRYIILDAKNFLDIASKLDYIEESQRRNIVRHFLLQFETYVLPKLSGLRTSVIHNDGNDYNLLVKKDESGNWQVSGIIDFGDMVHTFTVYEAAVTAAYALLGKEDVIAAAARVVAGYHAAFPLTDQELEVLFYLICARLCTSVTMSIYLESLEPTNEYLSVSRQPAWQALERLIHVDPRLARRAFRQACKMEPEPEKEGRSAEEILKIRCRHLGRNLSISYEKPLKIVRGWAQYLYDDTGRAYLDCVNNVGHVGHCHPAVVKAAASQMTILNTNTRYLHDHIVEYARRLCSLLPEPLGVCFFVNSGSEANDLALRLARTHTGRRDIVVVDHAYHGNLSSLIDISPYKFDGPGGSGAPAHVHKVTMPDVYRGPYRANDPQAGEKYANHVKEALERLAQNGTKAAAFISESLPGVGGQIVLPDNYLETAFRHVRKAGAVCIADEVHVGFGRMGSHFWGFETQGVVPDIVTLGKPIGNGHPLGAVVTIPQIAESFNNGMEYFNTFGGNPVSCAVGLAVLDVIKDERLQENARNVGAYLQEGLKRLLEKHHIIGDVRGLGLFLGIELVKDRKSLEPAAQEATLIIEEMKERGILLSIDGPLYNVLKVKPPLLFARDNADLLVNTLDEVLSTL